MKSECLSANSNATDKEIRELLSSFDLLECIDRHPLTLSGGQRQRLVICQACLLYTSGHRGKTNFSNRRKRTISAAPFHAAEYCRNSRRSSRNMPDIVMPDVYKRQKEDFAKIAEILKK